MKLLSHRWTRYSVVPALVVVAWQITSYLWFADNHRAAVVTKFLPQDTHIRGYHPEWACISASTIAAMTPHQIDTMESALQRRVATVYRDEKALPAERRRRSRQTPDGRVVEGGYPNGFIISMNPIGSGPFWFSAECSDYEGPLCAFGRKATFIWILGFWAHVWTTGEWIS